MKIKNKALMFVFCVALLVAVSVMGTIAYLTSTASVVNTFTVGDVKITLNEAAVDKMGVPIEGADRVIENEYHLLPGQEYTKDPMVTVKEGSEASYIRVLMTIHNASAVQAIIDNHDLGDYKALFDGWNEDVWLYEGYEADDTKNTITFEFRYKDTVAGVDDSGKDADIALAPLFTSIVVPDDVTGAELKALYGLGDTADDDFKMVLEGHAIQASGFADADAAWAAFTR